MARSGSRCVALYDYLAKEPEELTIKKNETLTVINSSGSWWEVKNDRGHRGSVPCNYIKELPGGGQTRQMPDEPMGMYQQTDLVMPTNGPILNIPAKAKFRYVSTRDDELSLEKGDDVIVLEKEADGWWRGRCGNRIGWFPFNYVEEIGGGMPVTEAPPMIQTAPPPQREKTYICSVLALYSFNSGNPEELVFQKGETLDIIDQPPDDPEWWEARKPNGETGLIPRNYVEIISDKQGGGGGGVQPPGASSFSPAGQAAPPPFAHEPWYYGRIARKEAERLLQHGGTDGTFLVRDSETKVRGRERESESE